MEVEYRLIVFGMVDLYEQGVVFSGLDGQDHIEPAITIGDLASGAECAGGLMDDEAAIREQVDVDVSEVAKRKYVTPVCRRGGVKGSP